MPKLVREWFGFCLLLAPLVIWPGWVSLHFGRFLLFLALLVVFAVFATFWIHHEARNETGAPKDDGEAGSEEEHP